MNETEYSDRSIDGDIDDMRHNNPLYDQILVSIRVVMEADHLPIDLVEYHVKILENWFNLGGENPYE